MPRITITHTAWPANTVHQIRLQPAKDYRKLLATCIQSVNQYLVLYMDGEISAWIHIDIKRSCHIYYGMAPV